MNKWMTAACMGLLFSAQHAMAADSTGCEGGGFTVLGKASGQSASLAPGSVASVFRVQGRYVQFDVDAATFGVLNYTLTGAPNALDITGGRATPVFESKMPDHRGVVLDGAVSLQLSTAGDVVLTRSGPGVTMKIQAKDCANGGLFQMEVARADDTKTVFTHKLAQSAFYFDNRAFRDREGDSVAYKDTTLKVAPRINFGNDYSARFVGRDSPQFADRIAEPRCSNDILTRTGTLSRVQHCGGVSQWAVASGGRMGQVMGEDATEVAPPATVCEHKCQAQNQTRGAATVLGFPFPVADADRLKPRLPQ
ncbi:hypothetical protein [Massilia sp. 9096]|uniref:hypothetical protein n=1 Tax=Massilia sp. 9096 TaxID=1500894 RepID=UPI000A566071|nr:hypothetical protein [Massilia sp. 9096]